MIGDVVNNYKISKVLGEGGMAIVYLGVHELLDTKVAIKFLRTEFVQNQNIRKRFLSEAKNMAKMSHPNVIKVSDLIDAGDIVAFVMEYIEGNSLKEHISNNSNIKDEEIKELMNQMLASLSYVHSKKLVHRDIKLSNFMLTKDKKVKLTDFGIAKNTDESSADYTQTGTSQQMGTPIYMSPEQVRSTKAVDHRSDIYSMGVVLWQMITKKRPYEVNTESNFDIQRKIVDEQLSLTNTKWDAIIQKATQKKVEDRYQSCDAFSKAVLSDAKPSQSETITEEEVEKTLVDSAIKEDKTINKENTSIKKSKLNSLGQYIFPLITFILCIYGVVCDVFPVYSFENSYLTYAPQLGWTAVVLFSVSIYLNFKINNVITKIIFSLGFSLFILLWFIYPFWWYH